MFSFNGMISKKLLFLIFTAALISALACGAGETVSTPAPPPAPTPTPVPKVRLPDEARTVSEAWRIIVEDFVGIEDVDPRALSDGAILGLLKVSKDETKSLSQARELAFELENADGYFSMTGGQELREAYEVWAYVYTNRQDASIDALDLDQAAIEGIIQALADPYTSFLNPDDLKLDQADLAGSFDGIGAYVAVNDEGYVVVIAPIENTPAERAGIRPGDTVLEVEGVPTNTMSLQESILKIRGPRGTEVSLLVKHLLDEEPVLLTITRGDIPVDSVGVHMVTDEIARIRINLFTRRTPDETREAILEAQRTGAKGIILDIRQNPGGLLAETVEVADQFLDGGLVLYEKDGDGRRVDWTAKAGGQGTEMPLVVLVDQFSASGAEVLAGALQDQHRATLIGAQTFGKGSVTHLRGLSDGSGIYVTFARWFTPLGRLIEGQGITPDIEVLVTEADVAAQRDPQMEAAIQHLEAILSESS